MQYKELHVTLSGMASKIDLFLSVEDEVLPGEKLFRRPTAYDRLVSDCLNSLDVVIYSYHNKQGHSK